MTGQGFQTPVSPAEEGIPLGGVAVIDVSDSGSPETVRLLQSPAGSFEHEGLEVHHRHGQAQAGRRLGP